MPIYARCSRCGKRIAPGKKCDCVKPKIKIDKSKNGSSTDDQKKETRKEYSTANWQRKRKAVMEHYLHIDPYIFYKNGKIVPADMVHHIEPLKENPGKLLQDKNLIPLSSKAHAVIEERYHDRALRATAQGELRAAQDYFDAIFYKEEAEPECDRPGREMEWKTKNESKSKD